MHESFRKRVLALWADYATRRPRLVVVIALLLAAMAMIVSGLGVHWGPIHVPPLEFQSDRNDLLSRDLDWNQRFLDWHAKFPGHEDLIIVVDTYGRNRTLDDDDVGKAQAFVDELVVALGQQTKTIGRITWGFNQDEVHARTLRIRPMDVFEDQLAEITEASMVLENATPEAFIVGAMAEAARQMRGPAAGDSTNNDEAEASAAAERGAASIKQFQQIVDAFALVLQTEPDSEVDLAAAMDGLAGANGWNYLTSTNGRLLMVMARPVRDESISSADPAIATVRQELAKLREHYPQVLAGVTGIEVVEADETRAAMRDSMRATILAVVMIGIVLIVAFHSWRVPLLAMVALLLGIAWTFGFLTLAVGHLQVLSVVFTVILLGLGIDFGIHLASKYETIRHDYPDTSEGFAAALRETFHSVGPGLVTGAVTTTAAFAVLWVTNWTRFKGTAELGMIAAVGVMLCLLAMLTVFPALLRIYKRRHRHLSPMDDRNFHLFEERWVVPFAARPLTTMTVVALITAVAGLGASRTLSRFDHNLLNLLPKKIDSMIWQNRMSTVGELPLWYGVCIVDDLEEAKKRTRRFRDLSRVSEVGGVGLLFPRDDAEKIAQVKVVREQLKPVLDAALADDPASAPPSDPRVSGDVFDQLKAAGLLLSLGRSQAPAQMQPGLAKLGESMAKLNEFGLALPADQRARRVGRLQQLYRQWRAGVAKVTDQALDTGPMQLEDLPLPLQRWYRSNDGRYLLEIYPKLPEGISDPLDPQFLGPFVRDMESVDPHITGSTAQIHRSGELIWSSFRNAGAIALIAVFVLVLIDFQRIGDALLALVPVIVGFIWLGGIMYAVGEKINPANIMVLPLLFGIGVDSGVHILHRYRSDPKTRPLGLTAGTGKGITITSVTTMIGFASMIPSSHRGIRSLGIVLTLGIALTLLACWIVLPAWLELWERRRGNKFDPEKHLS